MRPRFKSVHLFVIIRHCSPVSTRQVPHTNHRQPIGLESTYTLYQQGRGPFKLRRTLHCGNSSQEKSDSIAAISTITTIPSSQPNMSTSTHTTLNEAKPTNSLALSKSPYLLQHQHNPVDWYEWSPAAFERAEAENKPILLSSGYSACHWCHVMAHESFSSSQVAQVLNDHFINIKIDREERPDVDRLYMTFVQATIGRGGWPMTVFLTPKREPFFGGTYFPKDQFLNLLGRISTLWRTEKDAMAESGQDVMRQLKQLTMTKSTASSSSSSFLTDSERDNWQIISAVSKKIKNHYEDIFDSVHGGFGSQPKFPTPANTFYPLLREHHYSERNIAQGQGQSSRKVGSSKMTTERSGLDMTKITLSHIYNGGIHDHVGGGFSRYSVDRTWLVPHFEKMLYDQAQLLTSSLTTLLSLGHRLKPTPSITKTDDSQKVGEEEDSDASYKQTMVLMSIDIVNYLDECLRDPEGGFYSAEDADSFESHLQQSGGVKSGGDHNEKKEGAFYVWEYNELKDIFASSGSTTTGITAPKEFELFVDHFGVKPSGNVKSEYDIQGELVGKNILSIQRPLLETSRLHSVSFEKAQISVRELLRRLKNYRNEKRPRPDLDDKILTCWNGLILSSLSLAMDTLPLFSLESSNYLAETASADTGSPSADDQTYGTNLKQKLFRMASGIVRHLRTRAWDPEKQELRRSWRQGPGPRAMSDDYAFVIQGLLDWYEATGIEDDLMWARVLQEKQDELFYDKDGDGGGYYVSPADDPYLLVRLKDVQDGAEPSAASVTLSNLYKLGGFFHDRTEDYHRKAKSIVREGGGGEKLIKHAPWAVGTMVGNQWMANQEQGLVEFIVSGRAPSLSSTATPIASSSSPFSSSASLEPTSLMNPFQSVEPTTQAFLDLIKRHFVPNRILIHFDLEKPPLQLGQYNSVIQALIAARSSGSGSDRSDPEDVALRNSRVMEQSTDGVGGAEGNGDKGGREVNVRICQKGTCGLPITSLKELACHFH